MDDRQSQAARLHAAWAERRKKVKPKNELESKIETDRTYSAEAHRLRAQQALVPGYKTKQRPPTANITPPRKTTYGHGKGKGQTTVIDLGKNPSRAEQLKGAFEARGGRPSQYKAPKTTAPRLSDAQKQFMRDQNQPPAPYKPTKVSEIIEQNEKIAPHVPYVMKDTTNYSKWTPKTKFRAPNMKELAIGTLAAGAAVTAGVILKDQMKPKKADAVRKRAQLNERQRAILEDARKAAKPLQDQIARDREARNKANYIQISDVEWDKGTEIAKVKPQVKTWAELGKPGKVVDVSPGKRRQVKGLVQGKDKRWRPTKVVETTAPPTPKPVATVETARPTPVKQSRVDRIRGFFDPQAEAERQAAERARRAAVVESEPAGAEVPEKPGRVARARRSTANLITEAREAVAEAGNSVVGIVSPETAQAKREERAAKNSTQTEKAVVEQTKQTEQRTKAPKTEKPKTPQTKRQQQKHPQLEALRQAAAKAEATSLSIAMKNFRKPAKETPKQIDTTPEGQPQRQGEGARAQASQELAARHEARRAQQGTALRHAFEAAERADARTLEVAQLRQQLVAEKKEQKRLKQQKPPTKTKPKTQPRTGTVEDKFGATPAEVEAVAQSGQKVKPPTPKKQKQNKQKIKTAPKEVQEMVSAIDAATAAEVTSREQVERTDRRVGKERRDRANRPIKTQAIKDTGRPRAEVGGKTTTRRGTSVDQRKKTEVSPIEAQTAEVVTTPDEKKQAAKLRRQLAREKRKQEKLLQEQGKQPEQKQPKKGETPEQKAERQARNQAREAAKTPEEKAKDAFDLHNIKVNSEIENRRAAIEQAATQAEKDSLSKDLDKFIKSNEAEFNRLDRERVNAKRVADGLEPLAADDPYFTGEKTTTKPAETKTAADVAEKAALDKELELELRENKALKQNQAPTATPGEGRLKLGKAKSTKGFYKKLMAKIRARQNAPKFVEPKHPGERGAFTGDIQALPVGEGTEAQNEAAKAEMEARKKREQEIRDAQARKAREDRYHQRAASLTDIRPLDPEQARVGSFRPEADLAARTGYSEAELNDLITKIDPVSSGNTPENAVAAAEAAEKEAAKESKRRKGKVKEAQGDLVSDLARGDMKNVMMIDRNAKGEFETRILANEDLDRAVEEAREIERRGGEDRRQITRRDLRERMTIAEVSPYIKELGEERPPAKKETSRRKKQPGGDRRSETRIVTTPLDKPKTTRTAEPELELEDIKFDFEDPNERRGNWLMEDWPMEERQEAVEELQRRAAAGSKDAKMQLEMMQQEAIAKANLGRRAGETNAPSIERDLQTRIRELEHDFEGKPRLPLSLRAKPGEFSADTELADSRKGVTDLDFEKLNKTIAELEKLERSNQLHTLYKGKESLERLRNLAAGKAVPFDVPSTRALPPQSSLISEYEEGRDLLTQDVTIPDKERRGHKVSISETGERYTTPQPGRTRSTARERRKVEGEAPETRSLEDRRRFTFGLGAENEKRSGVERRVTEGPPPERRTPGESRRVRERRAPDQPLPRQGTVTYPRGIEPSPEPKFYERPAHWGRAVADWAGDVASSFRRYRGKARTLPGNAATELMGETGKAQGRQVVGKGAKMVGAMGPAVIGFSLLSGGEAAARDLYEGKSSAEAVGSALGATAEALPGVAKSLAEFTALDIAATKAIPAVVENAVRATGNALARRTAQSTAGRQIANAILRNATPAGVLARTVGTGGVVGLLAPSNVEAARTASQYMALPRQNKAAEVEATRNKEEMKRRYGTPERATATRKGWNPETGKPYTTDELYAMADEISGASAEWNKPENKAKQEADAAKAKRNKRIKDTVGKYYNKYADFVNNLF